MKKLTLSLFSIFALIAWTHAQTQPGFGTAKSQLMAHKSDLNDFLSLYGFSGIDGFEISQKDGPYKSYSYGANNSLYRYIWEPDVLTYNFEGIAPKIADDEEYTFKLTVSFVRSTFVNGYGELTGKYSFYSVGAMVDSYKGGKLNNAVLEKSLFSYTEFSPNSVSTRTDFKFTKIDSIAFVKNEEFSSSQHKTAQEYFVTLVGEGVHEWGEYEYSEIADLSVEYILTVDMVDGKWDGTGLYLKEEAVIKNQRENPNYPPCNAAIDVGVEPIYKKYDVVELPMDSYRYLMDLCRLIDSEYKRTKDEFIQIEALNKLFGSEAGKVALDEIYQLKTVIEKYHLTIEKLEVTPKYGRGVKDGDNNEISVYFYLNRDFSKEELKTLKSEGVEKSVLNTLKYPAKGSLYTTIELKNEGSELIVVSSYSGSQLKMKTGEYSTTKHPLN